MIVSDFKGSESPASSRHYAFSEIYSKEISFSHHRLTTTLSPPHIRIYWVHVRKCRSIYRHLRITRPPKPLWGFWMNTKWNPLPCALSPQKHTHRLPFQLSVPFSFKYLLLCQILLTPNSFIVQAKLDHNKWREIRLPWISQCSCSSLPGHRNLSAIKLESVCFLLSQNVIASSCMKISSVVICQVNFSDLCHLLRPAGYSLLQVTGLSPIIPGRLKGYLNRDLHVNMGRSSRI